VLLAECGETFAGDSSGAAKAVKGFVKRDIFLNR